MKRHYRPPARNHDGAAYKRFKSNTLRILPIFEPSGILERESHGNGGDTDGTEAIAIKYIEPPNATSALDFWEKHHEPVERRPLIRGILYKSEKEELVSEYSLELKSSYIIGRDLRWKNDDDDTDSSSSSSSSSAVTKPSVSADIRIPDPGCSKQHCVIQFLEKNDSLIPYIMDLDSTNGTTLNGILLPGARYVELRSEDIIRFSELDVDSRYELVFMCEGEIK